VFPNDGMSYDTLLKEADQPDVPDKANGARSGA